MSNKPEWETHIYYIRKAVDKIDNKLHEDLADMDSRVKKVERRMSWYSGVIAASSAIFAVVITNVKSIIKSLSETI